VTQRGEGKGEAAGFGGGGETTALELHLGSIVRCRAKKAGGDSSPVGEGPSGVKNGRRERKVDNISMPRTEEDKMIV